MVLCEQKSRALSALNLYKTNQINQAKQNNNLLMKMKIIYYVSL